VSIAIPRIRDFRGLNSRSFDGRGNYSLGVREQIIFPEIDYDAIDEVRGLDITITTTASTDVEAFALLSAFGMPFAAQGRPTGFDPEGDEPAEAEDGVEQVDTDGGDSTEQPDAASSAEPQDAADAPEAAAEPPEASAEPSDSSAGETVDVAAEEQTDGPGAEQDEDADQAKPDTAEKESTD
jgi:hypothetical protein